MLFIILFGVINYKWGFVATPVLQFGMYSQVFHTKDTQTVYIIEANNKVINCAEISLTNRDILQLYPENYEKEKIRNEAAYLTMKKYISFTGLSGFMNYEKFSNKISDSLFTIWFKTRVERITGSPVNSLHVFRQHFVWNSKELEAVDSLSKLKYLGTQLIP